MFQKISITQLSCSEMSDPTTRFHMYANMGLKKGKKGLHYKFNMHRAYLGLLAFNFQSKRSKFLVQLSYWMQLLALAQFNQTLVLVLVSIMFL